ncbi:MAG TPA: hypothetical protein DD381_04855 [Lentisphaeria bacterium]|nr:MAG: hypothetical protein A2X47_01765 [Lentisphaerae bacterium GWF2_38_69]HBM15659.1 hypothetical protein [Lentisphaeria bacterium]
MELQNYHTGNFFDEMLDEKSQIREPYQKLWEKLKNLPIQEIQQHQYVAERSLLNKGVTFNVYSENAGIEKIFPFDIIPRIIPGNEWEELDRGLKQRIAALNMFIDDVYNGQKAIKDKIIPRSIVLSSKDYLKEVQGFSPPHKIWCHISGIDLIRHSDGKYYILEDNLRVPSGVSYVLENRDITKRTFPELMEDLSIRTVLNYPSKLLEMLLFISGRQDAQAALLTPGIYNSAYFEHTFLAKQMGIELVEGNDLFVENDIVYMKTTRGPKRVHVIYRRIDDRFLDPTAFNPDSLLGVPGIFKAYKKNKIALANAPGTGVADDKVICSYVPKLIKYYLGEDAIIPNVPTFLCSIKKERDHVLANLSNMVVKAANQSGGYGMLVGPSASKKEISDFKDNIIANPRNYIAQPVMALSTVPTLVDDHLEGRHVDLRPYIICGESTYVISGGLTRVALKKGSLVVNSSQGGGSKDTWVVDSGSQEGGLYA